jgi:dTDP-L-rhamnose 4-epimerase
MISRICDAPQPVVVGKFRDGDVRAARCDIGPAADDLDWQPKRSLEDGLRALLHWIDEQPPMTVRATAESTSPTR